MTASPETIHALRASRAVAPASLRATVRELAAGESARRAALTRLQAPSRRFALVALPAAAALVLAAAGVVGLAGSGGSQLAVTKGSLDSATGGATTGATQAAPAPGTRAVSPPTPGVLAPGTTRAQRVTATLTAEVADSNAVSQAAQDALDLTRALGGYVASASVQTGTAAQASLTVRVPVEKVQQALAGFSALGKITAQQVTIDDLQQSLDALARRAASLRSQIIGITARLESQTLDPVTKAQLQARRSELQTELRAVRRSVAATSAEARLATMQLSVVTPASLGVVPTRSRVDRTLDGALNALVWEGVVALAILVVVAPFLLVGLAAWIGRRAYRRREADRLLAA